jgi:hypothetical protein
MKKLTEVPEETTPDVNTNASEIENLLAGYTEAATETPEPITEVQPHNLPPVQTEESGPVQWQGNPLYYQTGKKAGQLRAGAVKPKVTVTPNQTETSISGEIISGALFMTMIDLLLPLLFITANNYFSKTKIKAEDLQLTDKQKNELEPIAEKVAAQVRLTANPTVVLIFTLAGIYGLNFIKAKMIAEAKNKTKKDDNK